MVEQHGFEGGPIVVGRSEGEEWWELCLLSLEELLNLELFVCLCWSTAQQLFARTQSWQQHVDRRVHYRRQLHSPRQTDET